MGLVGCHRCGAVWPVQTAICGRCRKHLVSRDPRSLQRVWAWWTVALICYVPANIFPMLRTRTLFTTQENTIVGGAVELLMHGSFGIAVVILTASVLIPVAKFLAIAFLAVSVRRTDSISNRRRHDLYWVVEYIGRWSMIDVFVVAILSSLVQLKTLASINPGPASLFFALSVVFMMLSAQNFDSRLIWDIAPNPQKASPDDRHPT